MRQRKRSEDLVTTHPFLSDPWIAEVRRIKADHVGDPTDYAVALELVLDRSSNGLELALAHGDIEIDGDFEAFRGWWHSRVGDDATRELENDVRAITG
jgi:hypothetical protein